MSYLIDLIWPLPLATLVLGWLIGPLILHTLRTIGSRQTVSEYLPEHRGKQGTPTMGGLIVVVALMPVVVVEALRTFYAPLILLLGFALIGFVDDFVVARVAKGRRGLSWMPKLLLQAVVATGAALTLPAGPLGMAAAVFLVLFFANAYNFADGMDGLAGLIGIVLSLTLAAMIALIDGSLVALTLCIAVGLLTFLRFNWHPAKLFMGDVGSLPLGALIGLAMFSFIASEAALPVWALVVAGLIASAVMLAELLPVPIQIASVKLRRKRVFPSTPIHHAYQQAGHAEVRVVLGFALAQVVVSILALAIVWITLFTVIAPGGLSGR